MKALVVMILKLSTFILMWNSTRVFSQTTAPLQTCNGQGDIVFLIDGSESISAQEFNLVKGYVVKNVQQFNLDASIGIRIGALVFGETVSGAFSFQDINQTLSDVQGKISDFTQPKRATDTHIAIAYAVNMFMSDNTRQVPEVAVLITDGESSDYNKTVQAAMDARQNKNIAFIAVLVGKHNTTIDNAIQEVTEITGSISNVIMLEDYNDMTTLVGKAKLNTRLCDAVTTTTTTTTPQPTTTTDNPPSTAKLTVDPLCQGCFIDQGHGYTHISTDCTKFVQCSKIGDEIKGTVKKCSFGLHWSQSYLTCVDPFFSECTDQCANSAPGTSFPMLDNCRGYWMCIGGNSRGVCCDAGKGYVQGVGCQAQPSSACNQQCPPVPVTTTTTCDKTEDVNDPAYFYQALQRMRCALGTHFDKNTCSCTTHVSFTVTPSCDPLVYFDNSLAAFLERGSSYVLFVGMTDVLFVQGSPSLVRFNGNSVVNLWRLANYDFKQSIAIQLEITIPANNANLPQQVLANCLHASGPVMKPSIDIRLEAGLGGAFILVHTLITSSGEVSLSTTLPAASRTEVIYAYDGTNFVAYSNGIESFVPIDGDIPRRQTGFIFGTPWIRNIPNTVNSLVAEMSNIKIYDCIPDDIKNKLINI